MLEHNQFDIAIVGGAQSARAVLLTLAERINLGHWKHLPLSIVIIEREAEFATGLAWSPHQILSDHLSSVADNYSRAKYGEKQIPQFYALVKSLQQQGVQIELILNTEVIAIDLNADGYLLRLNTALFILSENIILATGHWQDKINNLNSSRFISSPWPARKLQNKVLSYMSKTPTKILLLGNYLNSADAIITIADELGKFTKKNNSSALLSYKTDYDFTLLSVSRNGLLPKVWGPKPLKYDPVFFSKAALDMCIEGDADSFLKLNDCIMLFMQELSHYSHAERLTKYSLSMKASSLINYVTKVVNLLSYKNTHKTLLRDIEAMDKVSLPYTLESSCFWQSIVFQSLLLLNNYSHYFSAEDQYIFSTKFRTLYYNHAMPMARDTAVRLEALMESGILSIMRAGSCYSLEKHDQGFYLNCGIADSHKKMHFDAIIDARGNMASIVNHPSMLIQNLLNNGLIQPSLRRFRSSAKDFIDKNRLSEGWSRFNYQEINNEYYIVLEGMYVNPKTCELIPANVTNENYQGSNTGGLYAMGPNVIGQFVDAQSLSQLSCDAARIITSMNRRKYLYPALTS